MKRRDALVGLIAIGFGAAADAQSSAVARAFMKLDARTETGVNSTDYSALVGEANLELKLYDASPEGKAHPEAVRLFRAALLQHMTAQQLWRYKLMPTGSRYPTTSIQIDSDVGRAFAQEFPDAMKSVSDGGARLSPQATAFHIDYMFSFYWRAAADLTKQAIGKM